MGELKLVVSEEVTADLYAALEAFLSKWDAMQPSIDSVCSLAAVHGTPYSGPTMVEELKAAEATLRKARGEQ